LQMTLMIGLCTVGGSFLYLQVPARKDSTARPMATAAMQ